MGGGLLVSSKFWAAMKAPKFVAVLAHEASSTSASGATAPAHSASRAASPFRAVRAWVGATRAGVNLAEGARIRRETESRAERSYIGCLYIGDFQDSRGLSLPRDWLVRVIEWRNVVDCGEIRRRLIIPLGIVKSVGASLAVKRKTRSGFLYQRFR